MRIRLLLPFRLTDSLSGLCEHDDGLALHAEGVEESPFQRRPDAGWEHEETGLGQNQ